MLVGSGKMIRGLRRGRVNEELDLRHSRFECLLW